jgi:hypothetical protein
MRDISASLMRGPKPATRSAERRFFAWTAALIAIFVFVGFSRTYYFHSLFGTPDLSVFLHIHGAVMSGWIVLFFAQTALVSMDRVAAHRALGTFGAVYAALVVLLGSSATVLSARREVRAHSDFVSSFLTVLALELTQILLFASLVGAAVWLRNRPSYHKRLMLLATLCMLPNVFVRLLLPLGVQSNIAFLSIWATLVVAIVLTDALRNRKLHPAFGIGVTVVLASMYLAYFASRTPLWQHFSARVVG